MKRQKKLIILVVLICLMIDFSSLYTSFQQYFNFNNEVQKTYDNDLGQTTNGIGNPQSSYLTETLNFIPNGDENFSKVSWTYPAYTSSRYYDNYWGDTSATRVVTNQYQNWNPLTNYTNASVNPEYIVPESADFDSTEGGVGLISLDAARRSFTYPLNNAKVNATKVEVDNTTKVIGINQAMWGRGNTTEDLYPNTNNGGFNTNYPGNREYSSLPIVDMGEGTDWTFGNQQNNAVTRTSTVSTSGLYFDTTLTSLRWYSTYYGDISAPQKYYWVRSEWDVTESYIVDYSFIFFHQDMNDGITSMYLYSDIQFTQLANAAALSYKPVTNLTAQTYSGSNRYNQSSQINVDVYGDINYSVYKKDEIAPLYSTMRSFSDDTLGNFNATSSDLNPSINIGEILNETSGSWYEYRIRVNISQRKFGFIQRNHYHSTGGNIDVAVIPYANSTDGVRIRVYNPRVLISEPVKIRKSGSTEQQVLISSINNVNWGVNRWIEPQDAATMTFAYQVPNTIIGHDGENGSLENGRMRAKLTILKNSVNTIYYYDSPKSFADIRNHNIGYGLGCDLFEWELNATIRANLNGSTSLKWEIGIVINGNFELNTTVLPTLCRIYFNHLNFTVKTYYSQYLTLNVKNMANTNVATARVDIYDTADPNTTKWGTTASNGNITFSGMYNSTWHITVNVSYSSRNYTIYNSELAIDTGDLYSYQYIYCNLTNAIITITNNGSGVAVPYTQVLFTNSENHSIQRYYETASNGIAYIEEIFNGTWHVMINQTIDGISYVALNSSLVYNTSSMYFSQSIRLNLTNLMINIFDKFNQPIENAKIYFENTVDPQLNYTQMTDEDGNATLTEVWFGTYRMIVNRTIASKTYVLINTTVALTATADRNRILNYKTFQSVYVNLELHFEDLVHAPIENAIVTIQDKTTPFTLLQGITGSDGNVTFVTVYNDVWKIKVNTTINEKNYLMLDVDYIVNTSEYVVYDTFWCNKTHLEFQIKDLGNNIVPNALVCIEDTLNASIKYTTIANGDGNGTFYNLYQSLWKIIINTTIEGYNYTILNSTFTLLTSNFVDFQTFIANLTNYQFIIQDYDGNIINEALVTIKNVEHPLIMKSGITDQDGKILFKEVFNGDWDLEVESTLLNTNYLVKNMTYEMNTILFFEEDTITDANRSTFNLYFVDSQIENEEYWSIYNAELNIFNLTSGEFITNYYSDINGMIELKVPKTEYNFTVNYLGQNRTFYFNVTTPNFLNSKTLDFRILEKNILTNISIGEKKTKLTIEQLNFEGLEGWTYDLGQDADITQMPFYIKLYRGDNATISMHFEEVQGPTINDSSIDANLYKDGSLIQNFNEFVDKSYGDYDFIFNSSGFLPGIYLLTLNVSYQPESYQSGYSEILITILNWSSEMTRIYPYSPNIEVKLNTNLNLQVNFTSTYPFFQNQTNAVLQYRIKNTIVSDNLFPLNDGIYSLTWNATLPLGVYTLEIFGNQTNFAYITFTQIFEITSYPTKIGSIIPVGYGVGLNSLKTTLDENISLWINYTQGDGSIFEDYSDVTITALMDNSVFLPIYFSSVTNLYYITLEAGFFNIGIHNLKITTSKTNYTTQIINVGCTIIEYWGTRTEIVELPTYYVWDENASFVIQYLGNEFPRTNYQIEGATISSLNITKMENGIVISQIVLDETAYLNGDWGWSDIGDGKYRIWFNTQVVPVSNESLNYIYPKIQYSIYREAQANTYLFIRPINAIINATLEDDTATSIENILSPKSENIEIIVQTYVVDEDSKYNHQKIADLSVRYYLYNKQGALLSTDNLVKDMIIPGNYLFNQSIDTIGNYTLVIEGVLSNYIIMNYSITIYILQEIIDFTVDIPSDSKISDNVFKFATTETVSLNFTTLNTEYAGANVYFDGISSNKFITTQPDNETISCIINASGLSIGYHILTIEIIQSNYITSSRNLTVEILDSWNSFVEIVEPLTEYKWSANASFIAQFFADEDPRTNTKISGANVVKLHLYPKGNNELITELNNTNRYSLWDWQDLSLNPIENYGTGYYQIWLNTSAVQLQADTQYYIRIFMNATLYRESSATSLFMIQLMNTQIQTKGVEPGNITNIFQDPIDFIYLEQGEEITILINWTIQDSGTTWDKHIVENGELNYTITFQNETFVDSGQFNYLGFGLYAINLSRTVSGSYLFNINGLKTNHYLENKSFGFMIGLNQFTFAVEIDSQNAVGTSSMKVGPFDNITFGLNFITWGLENANLSITINDYLFLPYTSINATYLQISVPASILYYGTYNIRIYGSKTNFLPYESNIELTILEGWGTVLDLITAPTMYPWNNNASFIVEYKSNENPRTGWILNDASITELIILSSDIELPLDGQFYGIGIHYVYDSNSIIWSYVNLGNGRYQITFNTSVINVQELSSFYIIPIIIQPNYNQSYVSPYLWIAPIKNEMRPVINLESENAISDLQVYLTQNSTIYCKYLINDPDSVMFNKVVTDISITYRIVDTNTNIQMKQGIATIYSSNITTGLAIYAINLNAFDLGLYRVEVTATRNNFETTTIVFLYNISKIPINIQFGQNIVSGNIKTPINYNISFIVTPIDGVTGLPLIGAIITVIFGEKEYIFPELTDNPGSYLITIFAEDLAVFEVNSVQLLKISFSKDNYTTGYTEIFINIGHPADLYIGVPYMYWIIIGGTVGASIMVLGISSAIKNARIPLEIKEIQKLRKIIKKKKVIPDKRLVPSQEQAMMAEYNEDWIFLELDMYKALYSVKLDFK